MISNKADVDRMRVLVVHRDFEAVYPLLNLLNDDPHQAMILAAESLYEAARTLTNHSFGLVLVDINLDRRGVFHTIDYLAKQAPGVPIALLVPDHQETFGDQLLDRGIFDALLCPSDFHAGIIKRMLRSATQLDSKAHALPYIDSLTGLGNRMLFQDRLSHAVVRCQREQKNLAVLLIDIQHFHDVNEMFGLHGGDATLIAVADRLRDKLRGQDTVARFGSDEFSLILENLTDIKDAGYIAQHLLKAFEQPVMLQNKPIHLALSIGIAIATPELPMNATTLLEQADVSRYRAKDKGGSCFEFFTATLNEAVKHEVEIAPKLQQALQRIFTQGTDSEEGE